MMVTGDLSACVQGAKEKRLGGAWGGQALRSEEVKAGVFKNWPSF